MGYVSFREGKEFEFGPFFFLPTQLKLRGINDIHPHGLATSRA